MMGLMQHWPLTLDRILDHAARCHGAREIVSRDADGVVHRTDYSTTDDRARRLSTALRALGMRSGDRIATLAWNSAAHFEAWYAIMGIGAVCHTLNPRMSVDQLAWIVDHAEDRLIVADHMFLPLVRELQARCPTISIIMVLGDFEADGVETADHLIAAHPPAGDWGDFEEEAACGLCYTSGTTGDPKGVLYSHRSNFLHALTLLQRDMFALGETDAVLPIVPMFHANAWGLVFASPAVGAKLVMPGPLLDGASLHRLIDQERVTFAAAVPTVWQGLLNHLETTGETLPSLNRALIGGAACPEWIIRALEERHGVTVSHAWGMTELSPVGTVWAPTAATQALPLAMRLPLRLKQGRPPLGVELKIEAGEDAGGAGHLKVRGFAAVRAYFRQNQPALDEQGFFDTGDIATIDEYGMMEITDRDKDVIKSGGEWISSIAIENIIAAHSAVACAVVVGTDHPRWGERPLLIVKLKDGEAAESDELLACLEGRIPRWWTPDATVITKQLPLGATGKIDKKGLRERYRNHLTAVTASP